MRGLPRGELSNNSNELLSHDKVVGQMSQDAVARLVVLEPLHVPCDDDPVRVEHRVEVDGLLLHARERVERHDHPPLRVRHDRP